VGVVWDCGNGGGQNSRRGEGGNIKKKNQTQKPPSGRKLKANGVATKNYRRRSAGEERKRRWKNERNSLKKNTLPEEGEVPMRRCTFFNFGGVKKKELSEKGVPDRWGLLCGNEKGGSNTKKKLCTGESNSNLKKARKTLAD